MNNTRLQRMVDTAEKLGWEYEEYDDTFGEDGMGHGKSYELSLGIRSDDNLISYPISIEVGPGGMFRCLDPAGGFARALLNEKDTHKIMREWFFEIANYADLDCFYVDDLSGKKTDTAALSLASAARNAVCELALLTEAFRSEGLLKV